MYLRSLNDEREALRFINALAAQFENRGRVTLQNGSTQTTVVDRRVNVTSEPILDPRSDAAKSVTYWISDIQDGSFVINHDVAATNREFAYVIVGVQWR